MLEPDTEFYDEFYSELASLDNLRCAMFQVMTDTENDPPVETYGSRDLIIRSSPTDEATLKVSHYRVSPFSV